MLRNRAAWPLVMASIVATGCLERESIPVSPCTSATLVQEVTITQVDQVDLLFMVDNSSSMSEEQASLIEELPRMVNILASGDFDQDGDGFGDGETNDPDFEPVRSLRVAVVTSDMGSGGHAVPTCSAPDFGDDGVLRTRGNTDAAGCMASYPSFLTFDRDSGVSAEAFARDVACVATAGIGGCGFEQPLESILKALSPSFATPWTAADFTPPTFHRNTHGHADGENDGFIRDQSVLAIIPLTDEEDCSARDPALFDPAGPFSGTHLNLRCSAHPEQLHPTDRFVQGLLQLRQDPRRLIYAPIVGVPVDLVPTGNDAPNWDTLLSDDPAIRDERLEQRADPTAPDRLQPSCNVPGRGVAYPPIRILRVGEQLEAAGAGVTVQSICQSSFEGALTQIIGWVRRALARSCIPRRLNLGPDGAVACNVVAVVPEGVDCSAIEGSEARRQDGVPVLRDGRSVCVIPQLIPVDRSAGADEPVGHGWYYDTFTSEALTSCGAQRIAFTVQPPTGSTLRFECFQSVDDAAPGEVTLGSFCSPEQEDLCAAGTSWGGAPLACDPHTRTCGVRCQTNADCRAAGLVGLVCDRRALSEVSPTDFTGGEPHDFCVNPTCE